MTAPGGVIIEHHGLSNPIYRILGGFKHVSIYPKEIPHLRSHFLLRLLPRVVPRNMLEPQTRVDGTHRAKMFQFGGPFSMRCFRLHAMDEEGFD